MHAYICECPNKLLVPNKLPDSHTNMYVHMFVCVCAHMCLHVRISVTSHSKLHIHK